MMRPEARGRGDAGQHTERSIKQTDEDNSSCFGRFYSDAGRCGQCFRQHRHRFQERRVRYRTSILLVQAPRCSRSRYMECRGWRFRRRSIQSDHVPPDQVLVGLYGKANIGPFIYSIAPICAAVLYNQRHQIASLSADLSKGDEVGSGQGDPFELKCPSNMLVIGSEWDSAIVNTNFGAHDYLVAPLRLRCASVLSSADASPIKTISEAGERQTSASAKPFSCPDGSAAFGIGGRAGQFIDALSLGCRAYK
jgi:hypothetical protein